ncbi:trehalose utilization protein ThuA [Bacillus sp. HMF5848]|uniref:ThuA domain-containing protein n=1 Tax=Bacillus sp. HMF5848 TaxID=2495421 RepID=UPI000F79C049|nr:ThuA domain-containing protein [Bacillus sp. HMF5848]RSK28894.1 trehalose utilization protein ThuA [Bacillus sp. HMF5848]
MNITIWNEYRHEQQNEEVRRVYPDGIHGVIKQFLLEDGFESVVTATLDEPEHGLTDEVLNNTDVLIWWGHIAHDEVSDEIVEKVKRRVHDGMGLIALHSAHYSKVFRGLMGTNCGLEWREADDKEILWVVDHTHPITQGIDKKIELDIEEMYGERFNIPEPDELLFISWFTGGEVFRSGCTYKRDKGKIFYFRPGHETFPTYYHKDIRRVICNAVRWAAPVGV